jgi:hypothetical protein
MHVFFIPSIQDIETLSEAQLAALALFLSEQHKKKKKDILALYGQTLNYLHFRTSL